MGNSIELFDSQIQTLKDRGCPEQIIEMFQDQEGAVLKKASSMSFAEGNIPFLPVIKPAYIGYYGLISMVRNGEKVGYAYLDLTAITDEFKTPSGLYYIYNVEDGQALLGKSPEESIKIIRIENLIKGQLRSSLTVAEVMALAVYTDVLLRHWVIAAGSRYKGSGWVPYVLLDRDRLKIDYDCHDYPNDRRGAASCGAR